MTKRLENYPGLYKEKTDAAYPVYIRSESIRDRSSMFNWQINPHLHTNLFQVFFITSGSVDLSMTAGRISLAAPAVIIIPPGNVHGLAYDPAITGHVLSLDYSYLEEILTPATALLIHFKTIQSFTDFEPVDTFQHIMSLVIQVHDEVFANREARNFALRSLLGLLFVMLSRMDSRQHEKTSMAGLNETYFHRFQQSFMSGTLFSKSVPDYAQEQGISAVHLNRVCNAIAGKSASGILQDYAISEAKKLLIHTSYSVSEIAYQLNFSDPGYFARLFKKHTGETPVSFRKQHLLNT